MATDLNNYRPISVIPTVAQIFEILIYDQLYQYLNENGLLRAVPRKYQLNVEIVKK